MQDELVGAAGPLERSHVPSLSGGVDRRIDADRDRVSGSVITSGLGIGAVEINLVVVQSLPVVVKLLIRISLGHPRNGGV